MLSYRQIEVLHAVLSTGSITRAAGVLNVSQPAVTKSVRHAEQRLGFGLFTRQGGRLQPTAEALALWEELEPVAARLESIRQLAETLRTREARSVLKVSTLISLSQTIVPEAIAALSRGRVRRHFALQALHTAELVADLLIRGTDIGFDLGGVDHPSVSRDTLVRGEWLCAAPHGLLPPGRTMDRRTFARQRVVSIAPSDPVARPLGEAGLLPESPELSVRSFPSALALVSLGQGVAIVDPFTALQRDRSSVSLHRLDPPVPLAVQRVTAQGRPIPAVADALSEAIARCANRAIERLDDELGR